jgi:hypothetical protein
MVRGDLDDVLRESFQKIKGDIETLNIRLDRLEARPSRELDEAAIKSIIEETVKKVLSETKDKATDPYVRKINRSRRLFLSNRILQLASNQNMTLPEVRDIVSIDEKLCSRATFYRHFARLVKQGKISTVNIDENTIIVKYNPSSENI